MCLRLRRKVAVRLVDVDDAPVRSRWTRIAEAIVVLLTVVAVVQLVLRGIGSGTTTIDPLVIAALEGTIVMAKGERSAEPIEAARDSLVRLLSPPVT